MLIFAGLTAAQARNRPSEMVANINGWSIHDEHGACSAGTIYSGGKIILLRYDAARDAVHMTVADPVWQAIVHERTYQVRILFDNGSEYPAGDAIGINLPGNAPVTGLNFHMAAGSFLRDFAGAGAFGLFMGDTRLGVFSLGGTRAMVARLRTCAEASNRRYPRDPFEGLDGRSGSAIGNSPPIRSAPMGAMSARANLGSYFSMDDYPAAALRANDQGTTGFRLTISPSGRVADCVITMSSGSAALDEATCRILRSRARYTPARDLNGNPAMGTDNGRVTWRLPVEAPPPDAALPIVPDDDPYPSRVWVEIATAADREGLERQYAALRSRARALLTGRRLWMAEMGSVQRGVVGPFESAGEARELVGRLQARNISASLWISRRSEPVVQAGVR